MRHDDPNDLVENILQSSKYRWMGIPGDTVKDLLGDALSHGEPPKTALKTVKRKLHNIVAPYLGDPNYETATGLLDQAFSSGAPSSVRDACAEILESHASTRERLPFLETFYDTIFSITGKPEIILDLACGLHPFSIPWMGLEGQISYHAYDIHSPRVDLLNHFFQLSGLPPLAVVQDVLVSPPDIRADIAFFFKEAHRFEKRKKGCNLPFWRALNVDWLLVSLPAVSLSGKNIEGAHRQLVHGILEEETWPVQEIIVGDEMVFCIDKRAEQKATQ